MFKRKRKHQYVNSYFKPITSMKINNIINKALPNNRMTDNEGLSKAYNAPNSIFIDGNRMYIAGIHNFRDIVDDLKIPFHDVQNTIIDLLKPRGAYDVALCNLTDIGSLHRNYGVIG